MKALLVRVGIDSTSDKKDRITGGIKSGNGEWNAPVNPYTGEFAYVPIPENEREVVSPEYKRTYKEFKKPCEKLGCPLPTEVIEKYPRVHLDPDFSNLTYGDNGNRGKRVKELEEDDIVAFYAGLRSTEPKTEPERRRELIYALIGLYVVDKVKMAKDIPEKDWYKNAHTRRPFDETDVVVFAKSGRSGRLERCITIGKYRERAYRVTNELLGEWDGLGVKNGYIQLSGTLPWFDNPEKFYEWFNSYINKHNIKLVERNN